jgi:ribosomal peptide maturation radical SAM protein 1
MPTAITPNVGDPVRLRLLNASFALAAAELRRRRAGGEAQPSEHLAETEAAELASALHRHFGELDVDALEGLHRQLARSLILEVDRTLAGPGELPGRRVDPAVPASEAPVIDGPLVGLVSLPWMSPAMPSIQLATVASALAAEGIAAEVHELYVDYSARIGLNLYNQLGNLIGFVPEWVFSRHYYGAEHGDWLSGLLDVNPLSDALPPPLGIHVLEALQPITQSFLDDVVAEVDWSRYDVIGCSLTISQLGASMAFARLVKQRNPETQVVFGGSQCAGPMGRAILRICPYVDAVVHVEGELVFGEVVRRLRASSSLLGVPGVSVRTGEGGIVTGPDAGLMRTADTKLPVDYDSYFRRLARLGIADKVNPWLPFESSRGCWYGQKVQCTFCGLHDIMSFRAWEADPVLAELERLHAKYGISRFYSMDLILPREYFHSLLPDIVRRGHDDWMFFYEVKANMRRHELELLAEAGVRWVQPGIESLDADLLRLMRKGVSPAQNVALLKWCAELGIFCGWNLLYGLPGERVESYRQMEALIPLLWHLQPPSGGGQFQLHRFSPYFEHPEEHGLRWLGADTMFRHAFPVAKADLDELVYLHDFELTGGATAVDSSSVEAAVREWQRAHRNGASLVFAEQERGDGLIVDRRSPAEPPRQHTLSAEQLRLYRRLDGVVGAKLLLTRLREEDPVLLTRIGGSEGLASLLATWRDAGLIVSLDDRIVALALDEARMAESRSRRMASSAARTAS